MYRKSTIDLYSNEYDQIQEKYLELKHISL